MAVREYVGARYVPLFADPIEWNDKRTYEPLTIVEHEGNSYTSRQFVPLGIDISNEDFWALTGNYNAQVEQYRQEVQQFDGRITKNTKGIAANTADIAKLTEKTSSLAHSKEFKGSNILYVTDSWGVNTTGVTKPYVNSLGDILGANLTSLSVGSTGYISGGTNNFINRLKAWADANPGKTGDIDYVMVCGSSNDYPHTTSEIAAAVTNSFHTLFPPSPTLKWWLSPSSRLISRHTHRWIPRTTTYGGKSMRLRRWRTTIIFGIGLASSLIPFTLWRSRPRRSCPPITSISRNQGIITWPNGFRRRCWG